MLPAYQIVLSCGGNPQDVALQNSTETLEQLDHAFDNIKRKLFSEMHDLIRRQVFPAHSSTQAELKLSDGSGGDTDSESGQESSNGIDEGSQDRTAMLER
jgi:arogenate dehydrogenase (NADP+), plant